MPWTPEVLYVAAGALLLAIGSGVVVLRRRLRGRALPPVPDAGRMGTPPVALQEGLTKTRQGLLARLQSVWAADAEVRLARLEEVLITADVGTKVTQALIAKLRPRARELTDMDGLRETLRSEMRAVLVNGVGAPPVAKPHVILVAGVNGVGKTTTIGKLGYHYRQAGKKVLLVAADTFRAAAIEQLQHWAQRIGAECVHHQGGGDPSAVAYDGVAAALARDVDVVIVDTAGRLHVKAHLIEELKKVSRTIGRLLEGAPHETLLVIDASAGQNSINQARIFQEALSLTGIVLTKLDGTAKGGAVFAIRSELGVPIRYVGLGEAPGDLAPFDADAFVDALLFSPSSS